jgi:hypothetical protein
MITAPPARTMIGIPMALINNQSLFTAHFPY